MTLRRQVTLLCCTEHATRYAVVLETSVSASHVGVLLCCV